MSRLDCVITVAFRARTPARHCGRVSLCWRNQSGVYTPEYRHEIKLRESLKAIEMICLEASESRGEFLNDIVDEIGERPAVYGGGATG